MEFLVGPSTPGSVLEIDEFPESAPPPPPAVLIVTHPDLFDLPDDDRDALRGVIESAAIGIQIVIRFMNGESIL